MNAYPPTTEEREYERQLREVNEALLISSVRQHELTEQAEQVAAELRESEERFRILADSAPALIWVNGLEGCEFVNRGYLEFLGVNDTNVRGYDWAPFIHPDDRDDYVNAYLRAMDARTPFNAEFRFRRHDGEYRSMRSVGQPRLGPNGEFLGYAGLTVDITERKQAEEARARLAAIVESSDDAIISKDLQGIITSWNKGAEKIFGYTAAEAVGQPVTMLIPPQRVDEEPHILESIRRGEAIVHYETVRRRKDGADIDISLTVSPIRDGAGTIIGASKVARDITERKQVEAERERLLEEERRLRRIAEEHNRAKDEFLLVLSHELRAPLHPILGYARLTRANPYNAAQVARYAEIVEQSAKTQQQLIEDLLDTARIISGKLKLEPALADLRLVLEDALSVMRLASEAKQIDLIARLGDEPLEIVGDAMRLQQVVWNLLQNAIKFTPAGGRVELRLERDGERARIVVSDTGKGIEPDFLPYVFDRFSQSDMSRTRRYGGLGLGLALVKQLVELHGGEIEAASAGAGAGATFTVTLPLRAPQVAVHKPPQAIAEVSSGPDAIPLGDLPRLDGVRVLVVDDQEEARLLVADVLKQRGAAVTAAASGAEALALLDRTTFDALVCDIAMPEEDGYETLRRIRAREAERRTPPAERLPAIAMTALGRTEDRLQALNAGFQMYVAKPVEIAELVVVIASLTRNRRQDVAVN